MTRGGRYPHWVTVYGARAADFERVFETACVPVTAPMPGFAMLPGFDAPEKVYLIDLDWVREEGHWDRLVDFLTERFGGDRAENDVELARVGMPIRADGVGISTSDMSWL